MSMSRVHRVAVVLASGLCLSTALAAMQPEGTKPAPQPSAQPNSQPSTQPNPQPNTVPNGQPSAQPGSPERAPGQPGDARRGPGGERPMNVEGSMKLMNRSLRQLEKALDTQPGAPASSKEDNLKAINEMQRGCVLAKGQAVPEGILRQAKDDAERAKLTASYRKDLIATLRLLVDAEEAIYDGKMEVAKAKVGELAALRDAAHERMHVGESNDSPFGR